MVFLETMVKPTVKVSVSDSESEETESDVGTETSENEMEVEADDENAENTDDDTEDTPLANEGWADSISKILTTNKPKNKKSLVLSRAKKHSDIIKKEKEEKPEFEVIGEEVEKKPEVKTEKCTIAEPAAKKIKHEKPSIRSKPNILEKDRERLLNKIATKGVVQLFNAVRNQQKTLEKELDRKDLGESKKERILKKFDKRAFLDTLMGGTKSVVVDDVTKPPKHELKTESEKPRWNALRDDFMTGAKMKDWDKESVDE